MEVLIPAAASPQSVDSTSSPCEVDSVSVLSSLSSSSNCWSGAAPSSSSSSPSRGSPSSCNISARGPSEVCTRLNRGRGEGAGEGTVEGTGEGARLPNFAATCFRIWSRTGLSGSSPKYFLHLAGSFRLTSAWLVPPVFQANRTGLDPGDPGPALRPQRSPREPREICLGGRAAAPDLLFSGVPDRLLDGFRPVWSSSNSASTRSCVPAWFRQNLATCAAVCV
mmetsp:Transcript_99437/g.259258  ORF Transcript_99437/g.259258 Transcript_99437/m.259258 type:complete len:223 (+) Transcript_99437:142-810(+)